MARRARNALGVAGLVLRGWRSAALRAFADSIRHAGLRSRLLARELGISAPEVLIGRQVVVDVPERLVCGAHVLLNDRLRILGRGGCTIGAYTYFAPDVSILTSGHDPTDMAETEAPVELGELCWIGAGVLILPGVRIGRGAVIGAGSVVTREVPPEVIALGHPAAVVRPREIRFPYRLPGGRHMLLAGGQVVREPFARGTSRTEHPRRT